MDSLDKMITLTITTFLISMIIVAMWVFGLEANRQRDTYPVISNLDYEVDCPVRGGDLITYPGEHQVRVTTVSGEYCTTSMITGHSTSTPGFMIGRRIRHNSTSTPTQLANN